jgi:hypothetical protein
MEKEDTKVAPTEEVKVTTEDSGSESPHSESFPVPAEKTDDGIVLIPHPSSDPRDPLVCTKHRALSRNHPKMNVTDPNCRIGLSGRRYFKLQSYQLLCLLVMLRPSVDSSI